MNEKHHGNPNLRRFLRLLTDIEPDGNPVISCLVNLRQPRGESLAEIEARARFVEARLSGERLENYREAFSQVRAALGEGFSRDSLGVAIYARWGDQPTFLTMEFKVPVETRLIVDDLPHIYPLIELKDSYERFVIAVTTESEARILETTIGAITREILAERPETRHRVGREWTRQHYGNHMRERSRQFLREKVKVIAKLMSGGGSNRLVLAGSPALTKRLEEALPRSLREQVVATIHGGNSEGLDPILREALEHVAAAENEESRGRAAVLEAAVLSGGLGVAGLDASRKALLGGYADMLLVDRSYGDPEALEELLRLARRTGAEIETVGDSQAMRRMAGVGCLLRYLPDNHEAEPIRLAS